MTVDTSLQRDLQASLDGLLQALTLETVGDDRFRAPSEQGRFVGRIYGGQLLAQALAGAGATVEGKRPHSLHAAFVAVGDIEQPVEIAVERVRDGRSTATRTVTVVQEEQALLTALVAFRTPGPGSDGAGRASDGTTPEGLPLLQTWAAEAPSEAGQSWLRHPPPLEVRMQEAPTFLGGEAGTGPRTHWMRLPRNVGDDPLLQAVLVAYASDLLLMDIVFRSHPHGPGVGRFAGFSVDHAIWFHQPTRFDRWHTHEQRMAALADGNGLAQGRIHDQSGRLVASVMQEVLVFPATRPSGN